MNRLGVFAKSWNPGEVKTRLAKSVGDVRASELYYQFLAITLEQMSSVHARKIICYWPANSRDRFSVLAGSNWELELQSRGDLGQRLTAFFDFPPGIGNGAGPTIAIGSDSPNLPPALVEQAFEMLDDSDVVLGPSTDGGYYLIGMRQFRPELFRDIPWSTPEVFSSSVDRCQSSNLTYSSLPAWRDVDELEDLRILRTSLELDRPTDCNRRLLEAVKKCLTGIGP